MLALPGWCLIFCFSGGGWQELAVEKQMPDQCEIKSTEIVGKCRKF